MATGEPDWAVLDEDVEVRDHDTPDQGNYRGPEGFARWLDDWGAAWTEWSIEPEEFIDAGERVVGVFLMKARGQGSGVEIKRQDAMVITMRAGKWVRVDYYNNRDQALETVGLAG